MAGLRGSPRIERLPSARGPNSIRPWNQPTAWPSASAWAVSSSMFDGARSQNALLRSRGASRHRPARIRGRDRSPACRRSRSAPRGPALHECDRPHSAAPRAPPASPAAGWIQMPRKRPSRSTLPLATQLSATPPARAQVLYPGLLGSVRGMRSTTSSVTAWMEAAMSMCFCVSRLSGSRAAGRRTARRSAHWSWSARRNS